VFVERCYRLMERRHGFAPAQRNYQLRLLYMLAHALYRSRHFADSVAYLEQGRALLQAKGSHTFAEFGPRFTFLLAANLAFLRRNPESIALLEQVLKATPALPVMDELTGRLQLVFHYFAEGNFSKANRTLLQLGRTDHWLEEHLGLEWLLKKNMGEMLIQLELGNEDLALGRLKAIERGLVEQFPAVPASPGPADGPVAEPTPAGGPYQFVLSYLDLVHDIINDPALAHRPAFAARVADFPAFLPSEREDLQAMSFYAWLRARMLGRPYYDVLLEVAEL
jgi:tetratricopeptide (TPR) repeat protein